MVHPMGLHDSNLVHLGRTQHPEPFLRHLDHGFGSAYTPIILALPSLYYSLSLS